VPAVLFVTWFTVDGSYWIYWHFKDPVALDAMRSTNFPASLSLYCFCGIGWLYCGSLMRAFLRRTSGLGQEREGALHEDAAAKPRRV
jgi:hypothetical protein